MRVAWLGLGIMGSLQAAHLARAGHELTVWNRTREKADSWAAEHGATVADSPQQAAEQADVLFTMLVDGPQVAATLDGVGREGLLCVDMSTIGAPAARAIGEQLAKSGASFMDAPVTGSAPKAKDGTLTIMAGGTAEDFARAEPLLREMGELVLHVGPLGHGQSIKVINNSVAAANTSAVGQALIAGAAAGVDLDKLVEVMGAGSGASAMLALKAGPMRERDYTTLFKLEHMLKDVQLCLDEAHAAGVPFEAASGALDVLAAGIGRGLGDADFAAMIEVLTGYAGRQLP
jgi:3-hydroxyisobutyrate dehydrogenase-like beta-hydroxyacid dehydrogenase